MDLPFDNQSRLDPPIQFDYFSRYNYNPLFSVGIFQLAMADDRKASQE